MRESPDRYSASRPSTSWFGSPPRPVYATCYSSIVSSGISIATVMRARTPACLTEHGCLSGCANRRPFPCLRRQYRRERVTPFYGSRSFRPRAPLLIAGAVTKKRLSNSSSLAGRRQRARLAAVPFLQGRELQHRIQQELLEPAVFGLQGFPFGARHIHLRLCRSRGGTSVAALSSGCLAR